MLLKKIRFICVLSVSCIFMSFGSQQQWQMQYNQPRNQYYQPQMQYSQWQNQYNQPQMQYNQPQMQYNQPQAQIQTPCSNFVFFWQVPEDILSGRRLPSRPWEIDESCLSQWYPSQFTICDTRFYNAEQFMMFCKAVFCNDYSTAAKILNTRDGSEIKRLGRQVTPFDPNWDQYAPYYVELANVEKFRQNPLLKDYLVSTGTKVLVEASPYDKIWGIGLDADDPRACDWQQWQGENKLGTILDTVKGRFIEFDNPLRPLLDRFSNINSLVKHIQNNGLQ